MKVLVVDVGGTHVKILATGQDEPRKFLSGPTVGRWFQPSRTARAIGSKPELQSESERRLAHDSSTNHLILLYRKLKGAA